MSENRCGQNPLQSLLERGDASQLRRGLDQRAHQLGTQVRQGAHLPRPALGAEHVLAVRQQAGFQRAHPQLHRARKQLLHVRARVVARPARRLRVHHQVDGGFVDFEHALVDGHGHVHGSWELLREKDSVHSARRLHQPRRRVQRLLELRGGAHVQAQHGAQAGHGAHVLVGGGGGLGGGPGALQQPGEAVLRGELQVQLQGLDWLAARQLARLRQLEQAQGGAEHARARRRRRALQPRLQHRGGVRKQVLRAHLQRGEGGGASRRDVRGELLHELLQQNGEPADATAHGGKLHQHPTRKQRARLVAIGRDAARRRHAEQPQPIRRHRRRLGVLPGHRRLLPGLRLPQLGDGAVSPLLEHGGGGGGQHDGHELLPGQRGALGHGPS
mmetsp:Transcript_31838/g.59870  ORF Transcript_31838/g.59870 Transcript_31838/m.59870 type:complete len:386 (+) Transcript_31838:1273-2430(+)